MRGLQHKPRALAFLELTVSPEWGRWQRGDTLGNLTIDHCRFQYRLKRGIRLCTIPKAIGILLLRMQPIAENVQSLQWTWKKTLYWPSYESPPHLLSHMTSMDRDVFLKDPDYEQFRFHLSRLISICLIYQYQALHLAEGTPFISVISAIGSCMKKQLSNMIPLTHCWSNKFIRDIGMRNEREVKQFQLIVCLSFILLIRFTHHAYMSQ